MIAAAALAADGADVCPHPLKRRQNTITIFPGGRPLDLCLGCFQGFRRLIALWDGNRIGTANVDRWFQRNGWPRSDYRAFVRQTLKAAR